MKIKQIGIFAVVSLLTFGGVGSAHAALIDNGDGTITDTSTNLMWLQDLNLTDTIGVDDALYGSDKNGALLWTDAMNWADSLEFAGYSDWRLSTADASCVDSFDPGMLTYNCTNSELGQLYYESLGNVANDLTVDLGPFINAPIYGQYWTATEYDANNAFDFHLDSGGQHIYSKDDPGAINNWGWFTPGSYTNVIAVRSIAPTNVPEPSSLLLIMGGIAGGMISRRRLKK